MGLNIIVVILLITSQKITLRDNKVFEARVKSFKDSLLVLEENGKFYISQVQQIEFLPAIAQTKGFADTIPVNEIIRIAEEATSKYKDANGIILLDDETNMLHNDGTRTHRYHFIGKIMKPEKREWADQRIGFEEERATVNVLLARTIHPDGSISCLDPTTIKISSPASGTVYFLRYKTLSFTLPKVGVNDIVEYVYEEYEKEPFDVKIFEPCGFLQSYEPTVKSRFKVVIPETLQLNFYTRKFPKDKEVPEITNLDHKKSYAWELEDILGIVREPLMRAQMDIAPAVFTTLFKDWNYLYDRYSGWQLPRMEVTSAIDSLVHKLVEPAKSIDDSIAIIYHWIQQNIRYICIKGSEAAGSSGHPASLTLRNGFGDCTDKSILLATMLRAIKVDAYPIYVQTNAGGTPPFHEVPVPWSDHAINEIRLPGRTFFLDPVSETYRYPYFATFDHGILCINAIAKSIDSIPTPPPESNAKIYNIEMNIEPTGDAIIEFNRKYTGGWEASLRGRWKYTRKSEYERTIQEIINEESPGAELIDYEIGPFEDLSQQFYLKWKYKLKDYPVKASDLLIFKIPGLGNYESKEVASTTRQYDIVYSTSFGVEQYAEVHIPGGYKIESLPSTIEIKCKYASYKGEYNKLSDSEIEFKDKFSRWARIVKVEDYQEYKEFITQVANFAQQQIFLKHNEK